MPYEKFRILESSGVPLEIENVDTDQIIPARFLKATERIDFDKNLFRDWRYNQDNTPKENFVLNNKIYSGKVLVAGKNFGSGSSREHAVWAIYDYGFRCVISSFFADIFKNNCLNIGVLPVQISAEFLQLIFDSIKKSPNVKLKINLIEQDVSISGISHKEKFEINPYKKENMMNGFDDIDYLLNMKSEIKKFATKRPF
ncbi:MAG: 3-isopropylmalate dehydratase small subunit [Flavobacteriaceae bacterium]|nr:3-isopropylmalate dehydratase small subunit [Flavobacteriaceae bacterium]|tara:strand:+ start:447 stop:1043 length:597 start_codon:yes stop_codon:yes gene_type:complete